VPPGETHLVLQATDMVWVRVNVDDGEDPGRILSPGDRREATGHHIAVRAGNAGALTVSTNGGPFEVFGRNDTPLTRQFGRAESDAPAPQSAAPAIPPATTPAPPAAATPTPSPATSSASASARAAQTPQRTAAGSTPAQTSAPATPEATVTRAAEAWLKAFFAGDRAAMARAGSPAAAIEDLRTPGDRPPAGVAVRRTLEQPLVRIAGNTAVYTARLVEMPQDGGAMYVSLVSQTWTRANGAFTLLAVRVVPERARGASR
jgi:hypothetical protein